MSEIRKRRNSMNLPMTQNEESVNFQPKKMSKILFFWTLFIIFVFIVAALFLKFCGDFMYYHHHNTELRDVARYRYEENCIDIKKTQKQQFETKCDDWGHEMNANIQFSSFIETLSGFNICKDAECGSRLLWTVLLVLLTAFITVILMLWLGLSAMIDRFKNEGRKDISSKVTPFVGTSKEV